MNVHGRPGPAMAPSCWDRVAEPKWVPWGAHSPCVSTADLRVLGRCPWVAREGCHCGRHNGSLEAQVEPRLVVQGIDSVSRGCVGGTQAERKNRKKTKTKNKKPQKPTKKKEKAKSYFLRKKDIYICSFILKSYLS